MANEEKDATPARQGEVYAVGIANISVRGDRLRSQYIQKAVEHAVLEANAEGIAVTEENSVKLKERMDAARERAREEFDALRRKPA